jgi:gluconate 5-dehydrogenase
VTWDDWNTILDTNLRGTFFMAQSMARHMIPRKQGRIINIGSVTSVFGYAGLTPYSASRGGVKQMTMSLASDASAYVTGQTLLVDGGITTGSTRALPLKKPV